MFSLERGRVKDDMIAVFKYLKCFHIEDRAELLFFFLLLQKVKPEPIS